VKASLLAVTALAGCIGSIGSTAAPVPSTAPVSPGPTAARRLTNVEYFDSVRDLLGVDISDLSAELPAEVAVGGFARALVDHPSELRSAAAATLAAAAAARTPVDRLATCTSCARPDETCQDAFVACQGRRLLRRTLDPDERARYRALFAAAESDDFQAGARLLLEALLQAPEMLYRTERRVAGRLAPGSLAARLAFAAWGAAPDESLLNAADAGALDTSEDVAATLDRMLDDARARRAAGRFADDWLDLARLETLPHDDARAAATPALVAEMRAESARLFARHALDEDRDLCDLLVDMHTEATPAVAALYGLPARGEPFASYDLAATDDRIGLLTEPAVLAATASASAGAAIVDRGLCVHRAPLSEEVPPPPPGVPRLADGAGAADEVERLARHRADPACGACHARIDPLGLALAPFDVLGRRSPDAAALVDTRAFARGLAADPRLGPCLARQWLGFALGRTLRPEDAPLADAMSGGQAVRYRALLNAFVTSAAFRAEGTP